MEPFTAEQKRILKSNPYTYSISDYRIQYTLEFKQYYMEERHKGNTSVKIFISAGYDPEILGKERIYTFAKNLRVEAESPGGLRAPVKYKCETDFAQKELDKEKTATAVKDLQKQIVHLEQELEFLKKISVLQQRFSKEKD